MEDIKKINFFKKGYELSWTNRYNSSELLLLIIAALFPILVLLEVNEIFILYFVLFVSAGLTVVDKKVGTRRQWSLFNKIVLGLAFAVPLLGLIFVLLVFSKVDMNNPILFLTILFLFFGCISALFACISFTLNLIFYIILKFLFPFDNGIKVDSINYKLKELSPYMSLPSQIAYLLLRIFYIILYFVFISMVFGWVAKFDEKNSENNTIATIEIWIVNSGLISLGNTLGVLSIILTLLTFTLPFSYRIISEAVNDFESQKGKINTNKLS